MMLFLVRFIIPYKKLLKSNIDPLYKEYATGVERLPRVMRGISPGFVRIPPGLCAESARVMCGFRPSLFQPGEGNYRSLSAFLLHRYPFFTLQYL